MAEKRMFSNKITQSDPFLSMPASSQNLYFHLGMDADDDGFVNRPKAIMRMVNANEDDMNILITRKFILPFEVQNKDELVSMVCVIKHWFIHNTIRADRKKDTTYIQQRDMLVITENGSYSFKTEEQITVLQPSDNHVTDKCRHRLDKNRLDKNRLDKNRLDKNNESIDSPFIMKNGSDYFVDIDFYDQIVKTYRNIDVDNEIEKMKMWLFANPDKRKKKSDMPRFINNWLSRNSDNVNTSKENKLVNEETVVMEGYDEAMEIFNKIVKEGGS